VELEELEVLFKVNTEALQPTLDKIQAAFSNFGMKVSDTTKSSMEKASSNMDLSKGLAKVQQQLTKMNETIGSYFNRAAENTDKGAAKTSQNAGKMFSGAQQKVKQDLDSVISTINSKMDQARAAQAKVNELLGRKNSLSNEQQNGKQGVQIDNQVASAQAQMTRYQNQAKALAQAMQREFNAIPDSLKRISTAMDQNEGKINTLRSQLKRLQQSYEDVQGAAQVSPGNKRTQANLTSLEKSMMSTRDKMNKLISGNDELAQSYAYIEDRAKPLKAALAQVDTELGSTAAVASKSSSVFSRLGGSMGNFGNRMRNIGSSIREATSGMRLFGSSSEMSMNRASRAGRSCYGVLSSIRQQLVFLPSMLLVYGLLYNGITNMASGMLSALKTNQQFATSLNQIKVNLLTAFYPIYSAVLPAINAMMSAISKATSWIAQFTSALFGMNYSTAKKGASSLYSQIQAMNDTGSASSKSSKAIKEANKQITASNKANAEAVKKANEQIRASNRTGAAQVKEANKQITASNKAAEASYEQQKKAAQDLADSLMGFDELNILDKNQSNDIQKPDKQSLESYDSQPTESSPDSQSLESSDDDGDSGDNGINFDTPNTVFGSAGDAAKELQKILGELFDPMKEAWDAKGQAVMDAAEYAWKELEHAVEDVGKSFMHVWDNGTGEKTVENLLQLLADMLNIIGDIAKAFSEAWEKNDAGTKLIQTIFNSLNDVLKLIHDIATSFRQAFNDNNLGEQIFSNLIKLATTLADIVGDFAKAFDAAWEKGNAGTNLFKAILNLANQVLVLLNNIATSFRNAFNDGTGEKIFSNILGIATDVFKIIGNFVGQFDKAWQHGNTGTSIFKTLLGMVNDMLGALKDMADYTVTWAKKLDFSPLLQSIDNLLQAIRPIAKDVWDGVAWGYENVLLPLAKFTITELVPNFLNLLAAALKLVGSIINAAKPAFQWIWDSFFEPIAKWTGGVIVGVMKDLTSIMSGLADVIDKHKTAFELVAKAIVTMLTVKLVAGGLDKGVGLVGKLADSATILSGNKHLLMDFFGKITGLSDLKSAVTNLKTIKDVTKELVVQNWQNFVTDAKNLASVTWSSFTKIGTLIIDLSKATWGEFMTYVSGMKKLAQMSWSGLVTAASAIKNWGGWAKLAAAGQVILNAAMDLNPYVLLAAAVAAVVVGLVALYSHDKKFRDFCNDVYKSITKWMGDSLTWLRKNWVQATVTIINPIAGVALWFLKDTSVGKSITKWAASLPGKAAGWAKSVGPEINQRISDAKKDIQKAGKNVGDWFNGFQSDANRELSNWAGGLGQLVSDAINGTKDKASDAKKLVQNAGQNIGTWINGFQSDANKVMSSWASSLGQLIHDAISGAKSKASSVENLVTEAGALIGNWVNDFHDSANKTMSSWASGLGTFVRNGINGSQTLAQQAGSALGNWVNDFRSNASRTASNWASSLGNTVRNGINGARDLAQNAGSTLGGWVNDFRNNASNTLSNWASSLGGTVRNGINGARSLAESAGSAIGSWISNFRGGTAQTLFNWAGNLGGSIATGIRNGLSAIKSAMNDVADTIKSPVKSAVNKVKDGINWVLNKVGAGSLSWGWFNWAKGTNSHPGGLAMVNDQQGPSYRESFELPNGKKGIFPDVRNLVLPLPKGTKVKTASETQKTMSHIMPHYASGIGSFDFDFSGLDALSKINWGDLFSGIGSGIGNIWDGVTDEFDSILSDISHPKKLLDYMINKFMTYDWGWSGTQTKLAKGTVGTLENGLTGWAKNIMKKFGIGTQTGPGATGWTDAVKKALAKLGLPTSSDYVSAWVKQIQTESGGNEKAMGGNDGLSDGNAEGLLQVKPPTFAAYHLSGFNDIWKGYDNMLAGINYARHRYGVSGMLDVIGHGHGYENGGYGDQQGLYPLFEGNKPEIVLPLTNKERTLSLIQQALKFIGMNFSNGFQMPSSLTARTSLTSSSSVSNEQNTATAGVTSGGINELGSTIVNALLQGLQMSSLNGTASDNPININLTVNMDSDQLGQAAIKGINSVNAKNHRNMLNL
jgi:SLT domain-containing protein/Mg2+ and Co2+ transporter CorA